MACYLTLCDIIVTWFCDFIRVYYYFFFFLLHPRTHGNLVKLFRLLYLWHIQNHECASGVKFSSSYMLIIFHFFDLKFTYNSAAPLYAASILYFSMGVPCVCIFSLLHKSSFKLFFLSHVEPVCVNWLFVVLYTFYCFYYSCSIWSVSSKFSTVIYKRYFLIKK